MHWRHATDPRLRELAAINVMLCYPEAEDVWEDQYDELNLCFGSTGLGLRLGRFDDEARTAYMHGCCIVMAWTLADQMSFTDPRFLVITVDEEHGWSGHVALMLDDATVLDFEGRRSVEEVLGDYPNHLRFEIMDADTVRMTLIHEEYRQYPLSYLGELERLVTIDFAQRIIAQAR